MSPEITDPEVQILAALAGQLERDDEKIERRRQIWEGSPFYWIKSRPSRSIGAIGEKLVAGWAATKNFDVTRPSNRDHDRLIEGLKVEIKFSTLWIDRPTYTFQQLRDQDYDYCFLLGVSPFDAQAWFVPKAEISYDRPPELVPQHGGSRGSDTRWLTFDAAHPPTWLLAYGGRLSAVAPLIREAAKAAAQH